MSSARSRWARASLIASSLDLIPSQNNVTITAWMTPPIVPSSTKADGEKQVSDPNHAAIPTTDGVVKFRHEDARALLQPASGVTSKE